MPPAPVKRVPPPPFLALTLPTTRLISKPAEKERYLELTVKGISTPRFAPPRTNTTPPDVEVGDESTLYTDQGLTTAKESKSLRYLIEKLNQINADMEGDVARVKVAIGEAENGIKLLRAQRAYKAERPNTDITPTLSENDARNDLQIC